MFDSGWREASPVGVPDDHTAWTRLAPGPALAAALAGGEAREIADDGGFDAAERLGGWEALAAWATGRLMRETAEYARARQGMVGSTPGRRELEAEAVAMEVAALARVAPRTGEIRVAQAICLVERLPRTLETLEAGRISLSHARVVIEQTEACSDEAARAVDDDLWDRPWRDRTPTQLRETVRRIIARLDPDNLRRRAEAARKGRSVRYWAEDDGATGVVQLRLPADQARGVYAVIDTLARRADDPADAEPRTLAQKRADTARDLILDAATAGHAPCTCSDHEPPRDVPADTPPADTPPADTPPARDGAVEETPADGGATSEKESRDPVRGLRSDTTTSPVRAEVRVTIPWETLAGSDRPAEMEGHGPIPAETARAMAGDPDSIWQRLLTDPVTGIAAHLDSRRYRPPAPMADFVRSRDLTCAAPGCRVPASRCDLDHVLPYDHAHPDGRGGKGRTRSRNLKPCCRRHHRMKTLTGWSCCTAPDPHGGDTPVIVWTSPSGHRWSVAAPALEPPPWDRATDPDHELLDTRASA